MSFDTLEIGATPGDEDCESVGPNYRPEMSKKECEEYKKLLMRIHGEPPEGASYRTVTNRHDYGTYYEVGIRFDTSNDAAIEYTFKVENDTPAQWDDMAMMNLDRFRVQNGLRPMFDKRLTNSI